MRSFVRKMLPIFPADRPICVVSVMRCVCGSVDTQSYQLNFHGRVTHASVKNFQIVHDTDGTCVRFFLCQPTYAKIPKNSQPVFTT